MHDLQRVGEALRRVREVLCRVEVLEARCAHPGPRRALELTSGYLGDAAHDLEADLGRMEKEGLQWARTA